MRNKQRGVTLMELLTVVMIIGILSAIAIPSYRQYTLRANRTDAKTSLMFLSGALERGYTRHNSYVYTGNSTTGCTVNFPQPSENSLYQITITTKPPDTDLTRSFMLTATPQGKQAADTGCGNLTLDSTNAKGNSGSKLPSECWGK